MDGTTEKQPQVDVQARLSEIKSHMPETYKAIQAKSQVIGRAAFAFVRRGVAGEPNNFYAIEGGRVVGTPFNLPGVKEELARMIAEWGCSYLIMWAPAAQEGKLDDAS